jgi:hypothetical protein
VSSDFGLTWEIKWLFRRLFTPSCSKKFRNFWILNKTIKCVIKDWSLKIENDREAMLTYLRINEKVFEFEKD